ncbi:MAG: cytochrome c family protein [Proteobacteria bacterium]|nr:cytochrome c family protein [Pseudomonadota bacterium]
MKEKITDFFKSKLASFGPSIGLALLITLFAIFFADILYQPKKMIKRGFQIELSSDGRPVVKKEEKPVDLASMMKLADLNRGEKIFKKCATCHTIAKGEAAKVGPNLHGIVGRKKAFTSFSYSDAMRAKGGSWDIESINQFITKPKDYVPGTKMAFPGLKKPQDRADVIMFLEKNR